MANLRLPDGTMLLPTTADGSGKTAARELSVAILAARFNDFIVNPMLDGALEVWRNSGGDPARVTLIRVPGAFELPLAAQRFAASGRFDCLVALGCVIRGDTPHFDFVAGESARGITQASLHTGVPIAFGVLTVNTLEQAQERADPARLNKGGEAMVTAIEMALLLQQV